MYISSLHLLQFTLPRHYSTSGGGIEAQAEANDGGAAIVTTVVTAQQGALLIALYYATAINHLAPADQ